MKAQYEEAINEIKEKLDRVKRIKIMSQSRIEQLNKQKEEMFLNLEKLNIKIDNLDSEIEKTQKEIEELLSKAYKLLPEDLFEIN